MDGRSSSTACRVSETSEEGAQGRGSLERTPVLSEYWPPLAVCPTGGFWRTCTGEGDTEAPEAEAVAEGGQHRAKGLRWGQRPALGGLLLPVPQLCDHSRQPTLSGPRAHGAALGGQSALPAPSLTLAPCFQRLFLGTKETQLFLCQPQEGSTQRL